MRTSPSQFDAMITFMEQHGDLSKPTSNPSGRIRCLNLWEDLANMLNSDSTGDTKTTEKWKKVWSDYKNNTKKKAARLHRAATGTGGGPAMFAKLSELEQRVLSITGVQVATGLAVEEAGLPQVMIINNPAIETPMPSQLVEFPIVEFDIPPSRTPPPRDSQPTQPLASTQIAHTHVLWNEPGPSTRQHIAPPPPPQMRESIASPSGPFVETEVEDSNFLSPSRPMMMETLTQERHVSGQNTPIRRRTRASRGTPRRRIRPAHSEQAAEQFLQAEEHWRKFRIQQHRDYMQMKQEQIRVRELELEIQRQWQTIGLRALEVLEQAIKK